MKNVKLRGADRRRLVRRRGSLRPVQHLPRDRRSNPEHANHAGRWARGRTAAGRAATATTSATCSFDAKTSEFFRENIEFPFFEHYLKGKGAAQLPEGRACSRPARTSGARIDAWPPKAAAAKTLYFHAGGKLGFEPPERDAAAFDEYVSDPEPARCRSSATPTTRHAAATTWSDDQRFAATRPDVLVYQTDPLDEDVTIAGPSRRSCTSRRPAPTPTSS